MAGEIFISYRRADAQHARRLHELLHAQGVEAWYDAHVGPGEDWRITTAQALEDSRIFVLLFSENAAASSDIAKELAAAVLEKKLIVPVRLENIAPKGAFLYELASRNWINAYDNTDAKLTELAAGLARMVKTGALDDTLLPFERVAAPSARWMVESSRPFISTVALEGEPAFSPDGKMLAYSSGTDRSSRKIHVRHVTRGDGIAISGDSCDDVSPSWSSDGTAIAYVARRKGEPCRIMVASVPAGETREVGRCTDVESSTVSWQPGTSFLYYFDRRGRMGHSIFRLDLDSGACQQLPKLEENTMQLFQEIVHLQCSPDGKSLLYIWGATAAAGAIVTRDLAGGTERMLGQIIGSGSGTWSEDFRRRAGGHGQRHRQPDHRVSCGWRHALSRLRHLDAHHPSGDRRARVAGAGDRYQPGKTWRASRPCRRRSPISSMLPMAGTGRRPSRRMARWPFCRTAPAPMPSG